MAYKKEDQSPSLIGDLWAYRPQLTLEHISQSLRDCDAVEKHSLLVYFLKEVSSRSCSLCLLQLLLKY